MFHLFPEKSPETDYSRPTEARVVDIVLTVWWNNQHHFNSEVGTIWTRNSEGIAIWISEKYNGEVDEYFALLQETPYASCCHAD